MSDIKHMKLLSGEEILCDLVDIQWDDNEGECMVMRAAFLLIATEDFNNGLRYYTFRPFMLQVYDPSHILLLNSAAVICMTTPVDNVKEQYINFIADVRKTHNFDNDPRDEDIFNQEEPEPKDEKVIAFKPKLH